VFPGRVSSGDSRAYPGARWDQTDRIIAGQ